MKNICKTFSDVPVLEDTCFELKQGEIHAILGENGAGKSTLMHILAGLYTADSGEIFINETPETISSPAIANKLKIGMIFQHFMLSKSHTALDNIIISRFPKPSFFLNRQKLRQEISDFCTPLGIIPDLDVPVSELSVSQQQKTEIVKTLYQGARILIFDEPTAVLTPDETKILFQLLRKMKKEGYSIILITHKLSEIMEISDRVTILRCGTAVKTLNTLNTTTKELSSLMFADNTILSPPVVKNENDIIFSLDAIDAVKNNKKVLNNISFSLRCGEIMGIAGISGNGQIELSELIAGLLPIKSGKLSVNGENFTSFNSADAITHGIGFIPSDRLKMGVAEGIPIAENLILKQYFSPPYSNGFLMNSSAVKQNAIEQIQKFDIRCPDAYSPAGNLSGGNLQKVILSREISTARSLIVAAYPSRGLDIRSTAFVHKCIKEFCLQGGAAVIISEEIEELFTLCSTIAVMYNGSINLIRPAGKLNIQTIGQAMAGVIHDTD